MNALIRRATVSDAAAIAAVHVRGWQWAYKGLIPDSYLDSLSAGLERRVEWWSGLLNDPNTPRWTWVAEADGRIVGFIDTCGSWDEDAVPATATVGSIYLEQSIARQGIGRALMQTAVGNLRRLGFSSVTLWVLDSNRGARRFYETLGWRQDGTTRAERRAEFELHEKRYRLALTASAGESGGP